jgi:hypothetical protein
MNAILPVLLLAVILAAGALAILVLVIAGINSEERQLNLSAPPRTRAEVLARRMLGVHISQPDARRVFAAHHAAIAAASAASAARHPRLAPSRAPAPAARPTAGRADQPAPASILTPS